MSWKDTKQAPHLVRHVENAHWMQMAQRRDQVVLMRAHSSIDRSKQTIAMQIKREQKILHRNLQVSDFSRIVKYILIDSLFYEALYLITNAQYTINASAKGD